MKKQKNKDINRSVPNGNEKEEKEQKLGTKELLAFLFWSGDPRLMEPLSLGVLLKRILLAFDNLLAICFVFLSFAILTYYGRGMDWQGAMEATGSYICGHPVLMSLMFIPLTLAYWRPIKGTKLMPLSHYVNDLVLLMFVAIWIFSLCLVLMTIINRFGSVDTDHDGAPYWLSCLRITIVFFLFVYRRFFLLIVYKKRTIWSLRRRLKKTNENEEAGGGVEDQSEHSFLRNGFTCFVFGMRQGAPAESLTYKLTPRRISIIMDNLIAPSVCYYISVWMRRLYYGVDCSFGAVVNDIFYDKDYGNIIILYLVMLFLFWRPLWYSDKKPCWSNFKEPMFYLFILLPSAFIIFFMWYTYSNLMEEGFMQVYTSYNRERGIYHFEHFVPLWFDIIRVIGVFTIFTVRRFLLLRDVEVPSKGQNQSSSES